MPSRRTGRHGGQWRLIDRGLKWRAAQRGLF